MKLVTRYLFKETLVFFAISLFAFTTILFTLRMLKFTTLIVNKGVALKQIAVIFLAIIPTFLEFALPMATILGVMLAVARLSGDSEIIVMRASGISIYQLIRPALLFGILAAALNLWVSLSLKPLGFRTLSRGLYEIARSKTTSGLDKGTFNKLGDLTLYAEDIDYRNGELSRVLIDDRRNPKERQIVLAESGLIRPDEAHRRIEFYLVNGSIHQLHEGKYVLTDFRTQNIGVDSSEINKTGEDSRETPPREMSNEMLQEYLQTPRVTTTTATNEYKRIYGRYLTESIKRFSIPYACLIMALLGLPLGLLSPRTQRTWGIGVSAALGLGVFVLYFGLFSIGVALSENGSLNAWIGLWTPNVCITLLAIYLLRQVGSERWATVTEPLERLVRRR